MLALVRCLPSVSEDIPLDQAPPVASAGRRAEHSTYALKAGLVEAILHLPDRVVLDGLFGLPAPFAPDGLKRAKLVRLIADAPEESLDGLAALLLAYTAAVGK